VLEVGCGAGRDAQVLARWGFAVHGIDRSAAAIREATARAKPKRQRIIFEVADFFHWKSEALFNVIYDKGVFHNLHSPAERDRFARRVSSLLAPDGLWTTVCGSADGIEGRAAHGAIYLQDLVVVAEPYFEVLEIVKGKYLTAKPALDFKAWHCLFRRR
jgi:SAM-dependent methyltransferase